MSGGFAYNIALAFALVSGTAAGVLALLTWEALRRSPFGRAVFLLSAVMVVFILYHGFLVVADTPPVWAKLFKSLMFTGVAAFIWMLIWSQHRLRSHPAVEPER